MFVRSPIDFEYSYKFLWRLFTLFPFSKHSKHSFKTFKWTLDQMIVSSWFSSSTTSASWVVIGDAINQHVYSYSFTWRRTVKDLIGNIQICYWRKFLYSDFVFYVLYWMNEFIVGSVFSSWTIFLRAEALASLAEQIRGENIILQQKTNTKDVIRRRRRETWFVYS